MSTKPVKKQTPKRAVAKRALKPSVKRPNQNPQPSTQFVKDISEVVQQVVADLENYSAHMRALDRKRHNSVGIKRQGFIERAYQLAQKNPEYLPHWLTIEKFDDDFDFFLALRGLVDLIDQTREIAWNLTVEAADMAYTDALEFYSPVQDAAKRRVDAAESIYSELHGFFRHGKRTGEEPTEEEIRRDVNALLKGRKDGKIVVENVRPKTTGGKRKVVDETYKNTVQVKDTDEASIKE